MARHSIDELKTQGELLAEELAGDPEFRREWERLALARAVGAEVVRFRADHELSQRELAKRLGMRQPQVARLENGEHNPSHETLVLLASRLGMEFNISIAPADRKPVLLTKRAREAATTRVESGQATLRFTAL
ncbi:helix-turn-helix transcriptional regulator [Miltoncostaea marina]|uniref:helix-turn-helix transcriptional regulator n=1 Tax=Miltoncostaea marina TaxID=2843215 RepID=UPI001C3D0C8D|nr:helix-turn-helix transcriptional regulator [Miltoncostaea marina]